MGEVQATTKRMGARRRETVASAPILPQPLALGSFCACAQGHRPPPPKREHGGRGRIEEKSLRWQVCGDLKLDGGWGQLHERSRAHSHIRAGDGLPEQRTSPPKRESWILERTTLPPTRSQPSPHRGSIRLPGAANGASLGSRRSAMAETHR